jgi:phosphoribosylaminoimidazole (AIR) synthetase
MQTPSSYKEAGVDIDLATELLGRVKPRLAAARRPEMLAPIFEAQNKILADYPLPQSNEPFGSLGAAFSNLKLK